VKAAGGRSIARRIAALGGAAAAVTAFVSASVPFLVLGLRLTASDARAVERLALAIETGVQRELRVEGSFDRAAREVLEETALEDARIEVWGPEGLVAAVGPGRMLGAGSTPADAQAHREKGRMVVRHPTARGTVIAVALPISFPRALRREMAWELLLGVLPLSALAAFVAARLARRALRPLEMLAEEVAARRPAGRWDLVQPPSSDVEITRLTDALNGMGARLSAALTAERELAAYAAHALRTPLTRLAVQTASSPPAVGRAVLSLQRLVDSLLLLSRSDARPGDAGATVNAADLLRQAARAREGSGREILVEAPDEALVRGDEELLAAALEHLLENAFAYAPAGTALRLSTEASGNSVVLAVADDGPGLAPGEAERVFEPFVRGAAAGSSDGSGLGLALVRRIAEAHGGFVRAVAAGPGTRFEVVLPAWKPR